LVVADANHFRVDLFLHAVHFIAEFVVHHNHVFVVGL
jgi:hypothetical protein